MKIFSVTIALFLVSAAMEKAVAQLYPVTITTTIVPPVNAYINQALTIAGSGVHVMLRNDSQEPVTFKFWGRIERIIPSPIIVETKIDYVKRSPFFKTLRSKEILYLTTDMFKEAFADFTEDDLSFTGISSLNELKDGLNYKLPEGQYRLCIYAKKYFVENNVLGEDAANPMIGCATFTICKLSAPQFIQPVNNLNINSPVPTVKPASPVVFTWIPPQASCSVPFNALTYNFEIREILDNQTITDAINNPFIFRKTSLRSSTFLLDTNLYKNILQPGKKYTVRVQAQELINNNSAPFAIENNGYSRIEAFQYGGYNADLQLSLPEPDSYLITFNERKTDFWDNVYTAYQNHTRGDTLLPVKEYIALVLTQSGIAYNSDAIELFLALNPDLADVKQVEISHTSKLPDFPVVPVNDRKQFYKEYETNLQPDIKEESIFKIFLDSLHVTSQKQNIPSNALKIINDLVPHLNEFNMQIHTVNRVSVSLINNLLSELLFVLHSKTFSSADYSKLRNIISNTLELITETPGSAMLLYPLSPNLRSLICYYKPETISNYKKKFGFVNDEEEPKEVKMSSSYLPSLQKQLLPFDVVVWRYSKEAPSRPVSDAPDLIGVYRVFYTAPALYNSKNPEINAKGTSHLASTAPVLLPSNSGYYVWTQNMLNHELTKAQKVEINDAFLLTNKKNWPDSKNYRIILKVD